MSHHNNKSQHSNLPQRQLFEGLEAGDLARLVSSEITVDEYKSKIGKDEEIIVLTLKVQGKSPALDLVSFIEKSYDWVLDADASSGELDDGTYLVFVEIDREDAAADYMVQLIDDIVNLVDIPKEEWQFSSSKPEGQVGADAEALRGMIPMTVADYQQVHRKHNETIDQLKNAAGIRVETRAPKNDFTESLRIAAGIR